MAFRDEPQTTTNAGLGHRFFNFTFVASWAFIAVSSILAVIATEFVSNNPDLTLESISVVNYGAGGEVTLWIKSSSTQIGLHQMEPGTYSISGFVCLQEGDGVGTLLLQNGQRVQCTSATKQFNCTDPNIVVPPAPDNYLRVVGSGGGTHPATCVGSTKFGVELTFKPL